MKRLIIVLAVAACSLAAPAVAAADCDPFGPAQVAAGAPTPKQILGFELGKKEVTSAEIQRFLAAVDAASGRVSTGIGATSVLGRPLGYAVVGADAAAAQAAAAQLMDPDTTAGEAAAIAASGKEILWIAGNVHGTEESGADAALRTLWELAFRTDCAAQQILDSAVVVIMPTQNPDGREADTRRNAYGFDMNRDWFARTQPETDGKLELLRRYPPVVFVDAHEMGSTRGYFFPPNADPVYHEISDTAVDWVNDLYGGAMQQVFNDRKIPYFNYSTYDLFYMGYGDTVPATGFGAAGMTFEKTDSDPVQKRVFEQYLTQWTTLSTAALHKQDVLTGWHDSWVQARDEGRAGELERNELFAPDSEEVLVQPPTTPVRQYFLRADDPDRSAEIAELVRRLQRMDVEVRRLTADLDVPDYTPYGRATRAATLPAETYVVSMDQRQKHWVQAMLNEDTYVPFPYFYDVTAWSLPLLANVAGGYSGAQLEMETEPAAAASQPSTDVQGEPAIALYSMSPQFGRGIESSGWLRWLLDQWHVDFADVSASDIAGGALAGYDVLLVPDGYATRDPSFKGDPYGLKDLGPSGRAAIHDWVADGGRYVGWLDGAVIASAAGISSATLEPAEQLGISSPGALVRTAVDTASPLAAGVGSFAYAFWDSRYVMRAHGAPAPLQFPADGSDDAFFSGYAAGIDALGGTAAVVDEQVGSGRTVAFSFEPNFRAFTAGTQKLLLNAIVGADPAVAGAASRRVDTLTRAAARRSALRMRSEHSAARLVVDARATRATRRLLGRRGLDARLVRARGRATFLIGTRGRSGDQVRWARGLGAAVRRAGLPVVMYRVP